MMGYGGAPSWPMPWPLLLLLLLLLLPPPLPVLSVADSGLVSGPLRITLPAGNSLARGLTITVDNGAGGARRTLWAAPPRTRLGSVESTLANGQLHCGPVQPAGTGTDAVGNFSALRAACTAGGADGRPVAVFYTMRAYTAPAPRSGLLLFEMAIPAGARVAAAPLALSSLAPPQFAPFPSFVIENTSAAEGLFYNAQRKDVMLCLTSGCAKTQIASKYTLVSTEGTGPVAGGNGTVALFFSYSPTHRDNWITTTAACPSPAYTNCGNADGFVYMTQDAAGTRLAVTAFYSPDGREHAVVASAEGKALCKSLGLVQHGVLGYLDPPPRPGQPAAHTWSVGVSGEVTSVPPGFKQQALMSYSADGITAAVDVFGAAIRRAHMPRKNDASDVFLQALTLWTDNGAATLGAGWHLVQPAATPPPYPAPGIGWLNINWSMVGTPVLSRLAADVRAHAAAPRGLQLDCWWYPVNQTKHQMWCGNDWVLPEQYYPKGTGGLAAAAGTPLMLYLPAVCPDGGIWRGQYNWTDTAAAGFLLPQAQDARRFFDNLFDYARLKARVPAGSADAWPFSWAPPAVKRGWRGTRVAAYETDFFWNMMSKTPEFRTNFGAGEAFLQGMNDAAEARNMTVQLCAGNANDFLKALGMPAITQGRASIDYDWIAEDADDSSNNANLNWAAPDGGYIFWATRMGLSKDNFWSRPAAPTLARLGYRPDTHNNGLDAELHAIAAVLTGVVGLGDYANFTDHALVRRLARADGVLVKPDRPLAPLDVYFGEQAGAARAMPGYRAGARLWGTHATVTLEDPVRAPELLPAGAATRALVSHTGIDAALHRTVGDALGAVPHVLSWIVVSVQQNSSFRVLADDLYPRPPANATLLYRHFDGPACTHGQNAIGSGCVAEAPPGAPLFDATTTDKPGTTTNPRPAKVWTVWPAQVLGARVVLLGDLSKYSVLSGTRFRIAHFHDTAIDVVVLGAPGEPVSMTYLTRDGTSAAWTVNVRRCTVGATGRTVVTLP